MGSHKITFFPSLPSVTCKPKYKCELVVNSQGQGNSPVILNDAKEPPERSNGTPLNETPEFQGLKVANLMLLVFHSSFLILQCIPLSPVPLPLFLAVKKLLTS